MPLVITLENGMTAVCWGKLAEVLKDVPKSVKYYEATPENARKCFPHLIED